MKTAVHTVTCQRVRNIAHTQKMVKKLVYLHKNNYFVIKLGVSVLLLGLAFKLVYNRSLEFSPVSDAPFLEKTQVISVDSQENTHQIPTKENSAEFIDGEGKCNHLIGEWVPHHGEPLYTNKSCSFIEDHQNCMKNGRPDTGYLYWRWKPRGCELPRLDPRRFLELMRNKQWAFIGDSISRNHVQSFICVLSTVEKATEVYHDESFKFRRWVFPMYNFTVSILWSPFLAKASIFEDINGVSTSEIELHLDILDKNWTEQYKSLDYIIISGGKWFTKTAIYYEDNAVLGCHHCSKGNFTDIGFNFAYRGWFTEFGGPTHERPVQDLAFAVARFIQKGGSFVNYYMYHGGTNFGRSAGGPFITTSYDYDAPLDEYGLIRQPKYGHLKELHRAVKLCEKALVSTDPIVTSLGNLQQAYVYSSESGGCAAFLSNFDTKSAVRVMFNNMHYNLPPWSISILPDCRNVVFNTAKVGVQTSQMEMIPSKTGMLSWETFNEDLSSLDDSSTFSAVGLLEQINVTRDVSDYLWYTTNVNIASSESFLHGGELPTLIVQSTGHALHVFVNGQLSGSASGTRQNRRFTFKGKVNLHAGSNKISLLSVAVGLPNVGGHYETWSTGVLGPVALLGLNQGKWDLSWAKWTYQVGLKGEAINLVSPTSISSVDWMQGSLIAQKQQPLTWHKAYFDAPDGDEPLALDMSSMGKGQLWVNGQSLGRYWTAYATGNCGGCSYTGSFRPTKCQVGCGEPTQRWYHLPRSWLKPSQNLLVLFEELGGNPMGINLVKRSLTGVCADVAEYHPNIKNWQIESYGKPEEFRKPKVHLRCGPGQTISSIKFASFGTPLGTCGNFQQGACHASTSHAILEKKCIGQQRCTVTISNSNFGQDPCPNVLKRLSVEAICAPSN